MAAPPNDPAEAPGRKRVAILGAGPAGLAAAFALSRTDALRRRHAVTIYQMGWRAGGKSGTGRAVDKGWRIEQNGSHYLFGCYGNSFALLREAYGILEDHQETGFGAYREQFVPRNFIGARSRCSDGTWESWFRHFPESPAWPDRGGKYPAPSHYLFVGFQLVLGLLLGLLIDTDRDPSRSAALLIKLFPLSPFHQGTWAGVVRGWALPMAWIVDGPLWALLRGFCRVPWLLLRALSPPTLPTHARRFALRAAEVVCRGLRRAMAMFDPQPWLQARGRRWGAARRFHRARVLMELLATAVLGVLRDRLWEPGRLESIDGEDFRAWLARQGASDEVCWCPVIKIWYDAVVAYEDGDERAPRISAAVTVYALFRAIVTYKGAFALQMTHEIGDSFIAPIVKALELHGVEFAFFHRVRDLVAGPDAEAPLIDEVVIEEQIPEARRRRHRRFVTMPGGPDASGADVLPREVWPNQPVFDGEDPTCAEGDVGGDDPPLDAYEHAPAGRGTPVTRVLRRGQHFDEIVFALPAEVARDFTALRSQADWVRMDQTVKSVATQSLRLWFRRSLPDLGWRYPHPILSGYTPPYSTWEDNGQNLGHERFAGLGAGQEPKAIATLFGPLRSSRAGPMSGPDRAQAVAEEEGRRFFDEQLEGLWPALGSTPDERYQALVAPPALTGVNRLAWQYRRANSGPIEAYVLALPGTLQHRLRPDESGFRNLYVAGEWTRNGLEVGCVEGAVMSGLSAARAICHEPIAVIGEDDIAFGPFRREPRSAQ
jgi:uncharacterized protein with NAD-binding domain and iron-sulfur cluster